MSRRIAVISFATEEDVRGAAQAAPEHGYRVVDAYTPYPVHGLDEAMGLRRSRLSWICFVGGLLGAAGALWFQHWTMAVDWPVNVGGKPWNSLPARMPVVFETMVALAGLGVVLAFLFRCRLFPGKPGVAPVRGATDNCFVLVLENLGTSYMVHAFRDLVADFHGTILPAEEEPRRPGRPRPVLNGLLFVGFIATLALYLVMGRDLSQRNYEYMPDMAHSPAYDTYAPNPDFADGKALQLPQPGTIPRGRMPLHYGRSLKEADRAGEELPNPFAAGDPGVLERGKFIYQKFCLFCHGAQGKGDGPVIARGMVRPPSLLDNAVLMKDGKLFHVLTYGILQKQMASYAAQLSREDRWKVILYVKSLKPKGKGVKRP
jgi:mono/diheme cytochrome c family protein